MAAVRRAVDSTRWGQPPRCIHMETLETALRCSASAASVVMVAVVVTSVSGGGGGGGEG